MGRRNYPHIKIYDDFVIKKFIRENTNLKLEYEKATMFFETCELIGITAPKVLNADFKQKTITFSRIKNYHSLEEHYIKTLTGKGDVEKELELELQSLAGKALAATHQNLSLQTRSSWTTTEAFEREIFHKTNCHTENFLSGTPQAFQHCDYGFANLGYQFKNDNKTPHLVVFDPSPNTYVSKMPNEYCSIYFDIGLYFSDING